MDDWVLLCKTRGELRTAVRLMNWGLERLQVRTHPFNTYIGRLKAAGFDVLGYRLVGKRGAGLGIAWPTWANHQRKLTRLYEQGASERCVEEYVIRWVRGVKSGVALVWDEAVMGLKVWDARTRGYYGCEGFRSVGLRSTLDPNQLGSSGLA